MHAEIETLQSVVVEICYTERRKELAREYDKKKSEDNSKSYKINIIS
jgi:hypothetical protein